jgi:hypothetical protein
MHAEIARRIFAKIGTTADVVDWGQLLHGHSFEGYLTVNLNKDTLIADCWLSHALLQGGAILNTRPLSADELFMPVSRSHGLAVQMHPKFPKLTSGALKTEMAALTSSFEASVFDWTQLMGQGSRRGHA